MPKTGPIIIVEDDIDDQEVIAEVIKELKAQNELIFFSRCNEAFDYHIETKQHPFIIICDVNLPGLNGMDLKRKIDSHPLLRKKSIPFIFLSTAAAQHIVTEAYTEMTVQGFFKKPNNFVYSD